ncbi:hypothetical protein [Methylobacterium sp. JK268]
MTDPRQHAVSVAIFRATDPEERAKLSEADRALSPSDLAAREALAAMEAASRAEETADGWEWMVVEVMGHRRHAGRVREEERFGAKLLRVDVPLKGDPERHGWKTHFYAASALFSFSPCERDAALAANKPYEPPARLSLPRPDEDEDDGMPF